MISLIVAIGNDNKVIGNQGKIPWHIKEEFAHFKNYTLNKTLLMGDVTFLSIGKPLINRKTIVATLNNFTYDHEDVTVVNDAIKVLNEYKNKDEELVICGGAGIYKLSLPYCEKLIISKIKKHYDGDAFFPDFEENFVLINHEEREEFYIDTYERRK